VVSQGLTSVSWIAAINQEIARALLKPLLVQDALGNFFIEATDEPKVLGQTSS
jgi:hypothetical protein